MLRRHHSSGRHPGGLLRSFLGARRGVAAVEFALLLPVMLILYLGAGEVAQAVMTSRKVEALSRALVDLTSQQPTTPQNGSTVTSSTPAPANATSQGALQLLLNASSAILAPASLTPLKMTVSAIDIANDSAGLCCTYKVRWSYTQSGTLRPCNVNLTLVSPSQAPSPTTIPNSLIPPVAQLPYPIPILIADVSYSYQAPVASAWFTFSGSTSRTSYMMPRTTGQVILAGPISATSNQSGAICY